VKKVSRLQGGRGVQGCNAEEPSIEEYDMADCARFRATAYCYTICLYGVAWMGRICPDSHSLYFPI
jgi:hypothetical protein